MGKNLEGKELGHGIIQKKNGRYEARYVDRFGKRRSISGSDLKDVKRRYNEAIYENDQEINIRENITLDNWYIKWLEVYKYNTIRKSTKNYYNHVYYKNISPYLGQYFLKDITQFKIRELMNQLDMQGYRYETKSKVKLILLDMFNKAMIDDFIRKNPAKGITIKRDENREMQVLSKRDQTDFFDCCKGTFYNNLFVVAITTGMRCGELAALRWEDIDLEKKIIHVRRTLIYQQYDEDDGKTFHFELPKTKASLRDIPINKQCEAALKKQYLQKHIIADKAPIEKKKNAKQEFSDLLFTTTCNTPLNAQMISQAIRKIVFEINRMRDVSDEMEDFSCHCFRHTFATRCFEAGIKPKTVQAYLGHATLQMTMDLYTSVLQEQKNSEIEKLEEELDKLEQYSDDITNQQYEEFCERGKKIINFGS